MNRRTLLGRFAALKSAQSAAKRPDYFRAVLEPLETRQLLSVTTLAWTIDTANSPITLALPDQTVAVPIGANTDNGVRLRKSEYDRQRRHVDRQERCDLWWLIGDRLRGRQLDSVHDERPD